MATLQHIDNVKYPTTDSDNQTSSPVTRICIEEMAKALFAITVGGLIGGAFLFLSAPYALQVMAATSAASATLYFANLSESKNIRDFLAMTIPGLAIIALLLAQTADPLAIGISLVIHVATCFYSALSKPNGAITELNLWPGLLGFQLVFLSYWGFTI